MITRAINIKRNIPVLLTAAIFYCVLLDWIMLGDRFWKTGLTGIMSVLCTLPMVLITYLAFSKMADMLRQRFPGDHHFFKRAFVQIFFVPAGYRADPFGSVQSVSCIRLDQQYL